MAVYMEIDSARGIQNLILAVLTIILIVGGNTLTIMAILKKPNLATPSNQFILGLALADLLVGLVLPYSTATFYMKFDVSGSYWLFTAKCLLATVPLLISCYSSFFHMFAIAVDRFLALTYPLKHKTHLTNGRARLIIVFLWCFSLVLATVPAYWNRNDLDPKFINCVNRTFPFHYFTCIMWPMYGLFTITFVLMYLRIWCIASGNTTDAKKPLKVIGLVVGCALVCWTPLAVALYFQLDPTKEINNDLYSFTYMLVTFNSFANPTIYAWKKEDFRKTFIQFLSCNVGNADSNGAHGNELEVPGVTLKSVSDVLV